MIIRKYHEGMGEAVAKRTILRRKKDGILETWQDVAERVAEGNTLLVKDRTSEKELENEKRNLFEHIASGRVLMSGRHLQHGDSSQPTRNLEIFSNCSTACTSALSFYLLLNGSGVGRAYYDELMLVDWSKAPNIACVLSKEHADQDGSWSDLETLLDVLPYIAGYNYRVFQVPDSREGWYQALELWETLARENPDQINTLVLDFSSVRPKNKPIGGMQDRPASGPVPLMEAFLKAAEVTKKGYPAWKTAMYIDHYFAECVLVGGARRSARIAVKYWKDKDVIDFIKVKNEGSLWTANNSVAVDAEFWSKVDGDAAAAEIFQALVDCSYGTGEPGLINVDRLSQDNSRIDYNNWEIGNDKLQLSVEAKQLYNEIMQICKNLKYSMIVNPCGEISLSIFGGYCVIADVVPYFADTLQEAEDAFRAATRALIRTNLMPSVYSKEVARTNRIGIGMTGVQEFAWKFFKLGFKDLIDEKKSAPFWEALSTFSDAVVREAEAYSFQLGTNTPHTILTSKPAGTTSKLWGITEGWHLPAKDFYVRWTQFRTDDPLVKEYSEKGYPIRELKKYSGTTIVGFPTETEIARLGLGNKLVLASEATPEEQYKWLMLGEKNWLQDEFGNQISYTLKYNSNEVSKEQFAEMLKKYQSQIKCCSVMPQRDDADLLELYEYLPEELVSKEEFEAIKAQIFEKTTEDVNRQHVDCEGGACPIDFKA